MQVEGMKRGESLEIERTVSDCEKWLQAYSCLSVIPHRNLLSHSMNLLLRRIFKGSDNRQICLHQKRIMHIFHKEVKKIL